MDIYLNYCDHTHMFRFPMCALEVQDTLDRIRQPDSKTVECTLVGTDVCVPELKGREFSASIYDLNMFATRIEEFDAEDRAAFRSLLQRHPDCTFDDMFQFAFAVDSVVTYPCADAEKLGEYAIQEQLLPELQGAADQLVAEDVPKPSESA